MLINTRWLETNRCRIGGRPHPHCKVCGGIIDDNPDGGCLPPCPGAIYRAAIAKSQKGGTP